MLTENTMMSSHAFTTKYKGIYNTFDDRMNMSLSNLTVESSMRYWEKSLIESVTKYARKKYGSLFESEIDMIPSKQTDHYKFDQEFPERIKVKEIGIKVATHNSWKEQTSVYAMMDDIGDSMSLKSVGKIKLRNIYVNEYTALYFLLRCKLTINLLNNDTEELNVNLGYALVMPDFYGGKYRNCSFKDVKMIMGPEKTIDSETIWTPDIFYGIGKGNPKGYVRFKISGTFKFKEPSVNMFETGADRKMKESFIELDTSKIEIDKSIKSQKDNYERNK